MGSSDSRPADEGRRRVTTRRSQSLPPRQHDRLSPQPPSSRRHRLYSALRHRLTSADDSAQASVSPSTAKHAVAKGRSTREVVRPLRELLAAWSLADVRALVAEFDAAAAVQRLCARADAARPPAPLLRDDLRALRRSGACADLTLSVGGRSVDAHSALLRHRSGFFRKLLPSSWKRLDVVTVDIADEGMDALLDYVYTGDVECAVVRQTRERLDVANTLERDAQSLLASAAQTGDVTLVFVAPRAASESPPPSARDDGSARSAKSSASSSSGASLSSRARFSQLLHADARSAAPAEYRCHSAVLAARSDFFRALLHKRLAEADERGRTPLRVHIDEAVIPRVFAPVLLTSLYTDRVDLSLVIRGVAARPNSLSAVQAIAAGKCQLSPIDEATELYQIARFLEFDSLAQGCEDVIARHVTADCLASVYNWSVESYGSAFVRRRCVALLCAEFTAIAQSAVLLDLEASLLADALRSDFLQATEADVLRAVVRWGEQQLVRRMEEREPNLLSGTTHSISRKGVRRAELPGAELRDILAPLLPLVRAAFVLPANHAVLTDAISRRFIAATPYALLGGDEQSSGAWPARAADDRWAPRPRLFAPYADEARRQLHKRVQVEERLHGQVESSSPRLRFGNWFRSPRSTLPQTSGGGASAAALRPLPDALYMVAAAKEQSDERPDAATLEDAPSAAELRRAEARVTHILATSADAHAALVCRCDYHRRAAELQVRLRVVREMSLAEAHAWPPTRAATRAASRPASSVDGAADERCLHGGSLPDVCAARSAPVAAPVAAVAVAARQNGGDELSLSLALDLLSDTPPTTTTRH